MIEIKIENVAINLPKMKDLLLLHWEEVATNKELMKLNPDWEKYNIIDASGKFLGLYAYDENVMVGYSLNVIDYHLHYKDLLVSSNDVLFLHRDYRKSSVGLRLKSETEKAAKELGAQLQIWHAKEGSALDKILNKQKYKVQDILYCKQL